MEHVVDVFEYINEPMYAFSDILEVAEEETEANDTALTILELGEMAWQV